MSKKGIVTGQWVESRKKISCILPLIEFVDGNNIITYCPALDISGYGSSEAESERSFKTTLSEYFRYTVNKGTLAEDLKKLGWKIKKDFKKPIPPTIESLLTTNEDFSRIFNTYDFRKRNTVVKMPLIA